MRRFTPFALVFALVLGASAALAQGKDPAKPAKEPVAQTKCPVSGEAIDKKTSPSVELQGQKVYFCCNKCAKEFKANPDKVFEKMAADGVVAENVQKTDPICGMAVDPAKNKVLDWKGRRLYFCSDGCKAKFEKDPATYLKKLDEKPKA